MRVSDGVGLSAIVPRQEALRHFGDRPLHPVGGDRGIAVVILDGVEELGTDGEVAL